MDDTRNMKKIAVGMSGGTDSSAAAALLVDQGLEVVGLTAHMWKEGSKCCSLEDVERARKVAWHLDIKHLVLNAQEVFTNEVVNPFLKEYLGGRTPSPCVLCNKMVKFGFLLNRAVQFECDAIATGHYARIEENDGVFSLRKARDLRKDQSYFLHRLNQRQLSHVVFPLGDMIKSEEVLPYVESRGMPISHRGESQDLCFVLDGDHGGFVENHSSSTAGSGRVVDTSGKLLGEHKGIYRYTVGQRKGLGIASTDPMYVTRIDTENNEVVLGRREEAMASECSIENISWISGRPPEDGWSCAVRLRYQHKEAPAKLELLDEETVSVHFEEPQFAVSPGQAGVIYDGDEVLGGGWIGMLDS
jgi:tRNA-specific 2-thiouridylase